jgi:hypothetical protein
MVRTVERSLFAAAVLAALLAACSPGPIIDRLPGDMGLPAGTPARPLPNNQYPTVYDTPPPRSAAPMSEEQQLKLENELTTVRDRQEKSQEGTAKKLAPPKKKKPADANSGQAAGPKDGTKDGVKTNP